MISSDTAIAYQGVLLPYDRLILVCIRVRKALDLAGLSPKKTVEVRPNLVALRCVKVMALGASRLQEVSPLKSTSIQSENVGIP